MKLREIYFLLFLLGICFRMSAQELSDIESLLESNNIENTEDGYEEMVNILLQLTTTPINVNTAGFDSLKMLFLLSDSQIDQILAFRKKYGHFLHIRELLWVPGLSYRDLDNIMPFITLGQQEDGERLVMIKKKIKQETLTRMRLTLPRQEGYRRYTPDDFEKKKDYDRKLENRFQGIPVGTLVKYKLTVGNHLQTGITLENDPGERYFTRYQKTGFDFLSAYLQVTTEHIIRNIIIGDYRLQWGQGLLAWGGFASGKSDMVVGNEKSGKGFTAYSSSDENNYLRGIAISISPCKDLLADLYFSNKKTDGNIISNDALAEEDLLTVSLYESGYHRNISECRKKHTLKELTTGMSLRWNTAWFKLGVNGLYYDFSPALIPGDRVYQQYNDEGKKRWLVSMDYKTAFRGIYFFGETAISNNGSCATLNGLRMSSSVISGSILYRRYDKRYVSHYAAGFGEYSNTSNEEGIYSGIDIILIKKLKLNIYYDWFRFFSSRYGAALPGSGWEILAEANYHHTAFEHTLRYKHEVRPEDCKGKSSVNRGKSEYRYQFIYQQSKQWEFRSRLSFSQYHKDKVRECGCMIYQDVIYAAPRSKFKMQYRLAWFRTDSYQSRIYAYENNVLYGYSFPAFIGKGWRTYLNLSYKPLKKLTFYLKSGFVIYPDREFISSGLTKVEGNKLYDITIQLRLNI